MKFGIFVLLIFCLTLEAKQLDFSIRAEGAILINGKTGAVLFEKNAYHPTYPASTTKIATAIYAINCLKEEGLARRFAASQDCVATISPGAKKQSNYRSPAHWLESDSSHVGIKRGEELAALDLLHAILISSANDASNVLASGISGSISKFMEELNLYFVERGCKQTYFLNPHGLHHPDHTTTPYDLALMAKWGLEIPLFREIVGKSRYICPETNLEFERTFNQTNRLIKRCSHFYRHAIGVKTGTTQAAGKNLVAAAEKDGRLLIAVALGHRGDRGGLYQDVTGLFEEAFNEPMMRCTLIPSGTTSLVKKVPGSRKKLQTMLQEGLYYDFYPAEECPVRATVQWSLPSLPLEKGTPVGRVVVVDCYDQVLQVAPLLAACDLKGTLFHRFKGYLAENGRGKKILALATLGVILFFLWRMRRKRSHRPRYL